MPVSNAKYVERTSVVVVDVPENDEPDAPTEPCEVRYLPNVITPNWARRIEAEQVGSDEFVDMFCQMVTYMDVIGPLSSDTEFDEHGIPVVVIPDGELVPVRPEYVGLCSSRLLGILFTGVMNDLNTTITPKGSEATPPVPISSKSSRSGSFSRGA